MNKSQINALPAPEWIIKYYWPMILVLIIWTVGIIYLVSIDIEIAKILFVSNIVAGPLLQLALVYIAERSKRYSNLDSWAWAIFLILSGTAIGYFIVLELFSDIWIVIVSVIGGMFGLGILYYFWRCMKKGTQS